MKQQTPLVTFSKPGISVIVADGAFPQSDFALDYLRKASRIICCDGAILKLEKAAFTPHVIVGDLDSISEEKKQQYAHLLHQDKNQETNDLTKAINWCIQNDINEVIVLGATGEREDHTLGNIGLLLEHAHRITLSYITDFGLFMPITKTAQIQSITGQQVSIFSFNNNCKITTKGLKYPLNNQALTLPWQGTLNQAESNSFTLELEGGSVVVFLANERKK